MKIYGLLKLLVLRWNNYI